MNSYLQKLLCLLCATVCVAAPSAERLSFHPLRLDAQGHILPWYSANPGASYDHTLGLVWFYWRHIPSYFYARPGLPTLGSPDTPKFMVSRTLENSGIGGDQFAMMLSSWAAYYQYTGDPALIDDMKYEADTYLAHSLSPETAIWPHLPFPCNVEPRMVYDGDLIAGKDVTQPDKAGSFASELITLYKITGDQKYLDAAVTIADVLAAKTQPGDSDHSPLPFKVNAITGEVKSAYTTNWTGTLRLFQELDQLHRGKTEDYTRAFGQILGWLKKYPVQTNKWGPFFEDVPGWSDTQINATTLAWYLMENKSWDPDWKQDVRRIQDWVIAKLGNPSLQDKLGVLTINEQTAYPIPGQSHTSRHASVELRYAAETGDSRNREMAIRQLNWATYYVDDDGKNRYPDPNSYEVWWTDGYGDFVRHYLRAMAWDPELAPPGQNHILRSTSTVRSVSYKSRAIEYATYGKDSEEILRTASKPSRVLLSGKPSKDWTWRPLSNGGVLTVRHKDSAQVSIQL